jgi:hypothetical protein
VIDTSLGARGRVSRDVANGLGRGGTKVCGTSEASTKLLSTHAIAAIYHKYSKASFYAAAVPAGGSGARRRPHCHHFGVVEDSETEATSKLG